MVDVAFIILFDLLGNYLINKIGLPGILECATIAIVSHFLLDFSFYEAGMLGFIVAAVSPAGVVPTMLELKEVGSGKKNDVPTLILAGASLENAVAITIFSVFAGLAAGASTNWTYIILGVPAGILLGGIIGAGISFFMVWFFKKYHLRDTMKVILFMIIAAIFYDFSESPAIKEIIPIAALLGIMAIGFVLLEKYDIHDSGYWTDDPGRCCSQHCFTAPLGAIGIKWAGPKLLRQEN
jgi:Kef-type K+ transport system membrane component KefB